jgi:hypothetical protein
LALPLDEGWGSLAVVGVAKNCGKTTALNRLIEDDCRRGLTLGLLSIGIDGESTDRLTGGDKPDVTLPAGHWVVAGHRALERSPVRFEYVQPLSGRSSPLGDLIVARTLESGPVLLAGIRHRDDVLAARDALERHAIDRVLIDGAYDRFVAADPAIADGVVLATGAIVGETPQAVVDATAPRIEQLHLSPPESSHHRSAIESALRRQRVLLAAPDGTLQTLSTRSALVGLDEVADVWNTDIDTVAIPGAVTDRMVERLLALEGPPGTLVASDPTAFQTSPETWQRLSETWNVHVHRATTLLGVALNPHRVDGTSLDGSAMRRRFGDRWPELTLFDPKRREQGRWTTSDSV